MSLMLDKMRARRKQQQQPKPRYRVRNGKIVIRLYAELAKRKPASNVAVLLPREHSAHRIGGSCPHCNGTGVYRWHTSTQEGKCFRCNGKGTINSRDMAFLGARHKGAGPISHVLSA